MDKTPIPSEPHYRMEGFTNQRICIVPRPQVVAALARPGTRRLFVTDAGFFPAAEGHRRVRPTGTTETIVIFCTAGSGIVTLGGDRHALTPGACIVIPAGAPHQYVTCPENPWTIWWLHVRGTDVPDLTQLLTSGQRPVLRLRSIDRVVSLFDELVSLLERRLSPAHLLAASGVGWHLLSRIVADSILPADSSPLERAMRYLESRVDGTIQVKELAELVGMSPSHLSSLFREATGSGPNAFHTSLKMSQARGMLDTTTMPVTEIALAVGYTDPLYFSRHFRRIHGTSPTLYRAQHKG